jgi:hypothetical protein
MAMAEALVITQLRAALSGCVDAYSQMFLKIAKEKLEKFSGNSSYYGNAAK